MDAVTVRAVSLGSDAAQQVPQAAFDGTDRFSGWNPLAARLALLALALLMILAAIVPLDEPGGEQSVVSTHASGEPVLGADESDQDIALYEAVTRKVQAGENYYDFIVSEHRLRNYPVRPGFTVRLPTLAYIEAGLNTVHLGVVMAIVVLAGTIFAWWRRFGDEAGVGRLRRVATALVFLGGSLLLNRHYYALHELWAGALLTLSLGLHRVRSGQKPGRWGAALLVAGLALFIREHSLPFVLLMGAMALYRREWREAAAWGALVAIFAAVLALHLSLISPQLLPSDPNGASWWAFRGLSGWIGNVVQAGNLRLLPDWIAGPAVILTVLGWAGWRTPLGVFGFFIAVGYGLLFMVIGRWNNFYWGAIVAPMLTPGIAFAPRAIMALVRSARSGKMASAWQCNPVL